MRNPILVIILVLICAGLLAGCVASGDRGLPVNRAGEVEPRGQGVFGRPIFIPGHMFVLFPFAFEIRDSGRSAFTMGSSFVLLGSSASYSFTDPAGGSGLRWNNLAIHNARNNQTSLLLNYPALITEFHAPRADGKGVVRGEYLLLGIADRDTNRDGWINADDAIVLARCDLDGGNLVTLTEPNTRLEKLNISDDGSVLYARIRRDSDADGKFTARDTLMIMRCPGSPPGTAEPVFPESIRAQAIGAAHGRPKPATP